MQSAGVSSSARHIAGPHASQAVSCFPTKPNLRHPVRSRCAVETPGMAEKQPRQTQTSGTAAKPLGAGLPSLPLGQKPFCSAADGSARAAGCCHLFVMHRSFTPCFCSVSHSGLPALWTNAAAVLQNTSSRGCRWQFSAIAGFNYELGGASELEPSCNTAGW